MDMRTNSNRIHAPARALAAAIALTLAGCGLGMTAEQRIDKAREYMGSANYPAAIIELKNALQEDPVNLPARVLLAEASYKAGDFDTAVKEFERAIDLGADPEAFRLDFADAMVRSGRAERALETADPAKVAAAERGRAQLIQGQALTALGRLDEAETALEAARRDPARAFEADLARARLALLRNQPAQAREILEGLGSAREQSSEYWEILAAVQASEGDRAAAVGSLRKAIDTISETFGMRRFMLRGSLAEMLLANGEVDEARRIAERLHRDARQHPLPNYLMSRVEYQSGNYQQALAYAQSLLSIQPGAPIGNTLAGAASLALNQPAQAENYLARAVEADPNNATARKLLAQTRLGLGSPQDALATLRPIAGTDAEATALAGMASIRAGDPEAAIQLFRREVDKDPANDNMRMQLVVSLMAAGRNDEALAELGMMKGLDDAGQLRADLIEVAVHIQADDLARPAALPPRRPMRARRIRRCATAWAHCSSPPTSLAMPKPGSATRCGSSRATPRPSSTWAGSPPRAAAPKRPRPASMPCSRPTRAMPRPRPRWRSWPGAPGGAPTPYDGWRNCGPATPARCRRGSCWRSSCRRRAGAARRWPSRARPPPPSRTTSRP
jgi:cellulose synthase operon protein C